MSSASLFHHKGIQWWNSLLLDIKGHLVILAKQLVLYLDYDYVFVCDCCFTDLVIVLVYTELYTVCMCSYIYSMMLPVFTPVLL